MGGQASGLTPQGFADGGFGGFDRGEELAVDAESVELDGEKPEALSGRDQDPLGLAIDVDGYGSGTVGLDEMGMLHGNNLHRHVGDDGRVLAELDDE